MHAPAPPFDQPLQPLQGPRLAQLGLWDAVSLIVGIVIGSTIFKAPTMVFGNLNCAGAALGLWAVGGLLSLIGALCYAELATAYPRSGGDYVYLTRAYGPFVGFLFGWSHLAGILTGSIGALAFVFADYAVQTFSCDDFTGFWLALSAVGLLSLLNVFGLVLGKQAQNVLTVLKIAGLGGVIAAGVGWGLVNGVEWNLSRTTPAPAAPNWGLALIFVLYAYGGWNDAAFVAAEVRDRKRNVPLALLGGVGLITLIYLLVNLGYVMGLGFDAARASATPAADVLRQPLGDGASRAMSLLVMVSALGGVNGLILTGSRVHASLGADHHVFAWLGRWHPRWNTPVASLITQALVTAGLMMLVGTPWGRDLLDALNRFIAGEELDWNRFGGGFDLLVATTAPVFWFFFLLTGTAVITLRWKDPLAERPFRVPLFPLVPLVFCATCGYMLYASIAWAKTLALIPLIPLSAGVVLYLASRRLEGRSRTV